jgi:hypothetical protein
MKGRRQFRDRAASDRLAKVLDFERIDHATGVASVQKTWQFAQQLTAPADHAAMAAELAEFFQAEVLRIEAQAPEGE